MLQFWHAEGQSQQQHLGPQNTDAVCMQVPEALDFGFTPVKHNSRNTIQVQNTGDAAVQCRWQISQPFSIAPETASIDAGQSVAFEVAFCPEEASVYTVLAACHAETGLTATIKVSTAL